MDRNVNIGPGFSTLSPEDRIRQLRSVGANDAGARAASDVQDFANIFGQPASGSDPAYGMAMANFLAKRGHNVNLNM